MNFGSPAVNEILRYRSKIISPRLHHITVPCRLQGSSLLNSAILQRRELLAQDKQLRWTGLAKQTPGDEHTP